MTLRLLALLVAVSLASFGCDGEDDNDMGMDDAMSMQPESTCEDGEVIVAYVGTDNDRDECSAPPAACDVEDPCFDDDCVGALYALCEEGTLGSACADFGGPVTVSCN